GEPWAVSRNRETPPNVLAALAGGGRAELDADDARAAETVAGAADSGHVVLPARGLAPVAAAVAVSGVAAARTSVLPYGAPAAGTTGRSAGTCVVARGSAGALASWLGGFDDVPAARGVLGLDVGSPREQWLQWRPGRLLDTPGGAGRAALAA